MAQSDTPRLSAGEIDQFVHRGFVRIDGAFSRDMAATACDILWREAGCDPDDPATWPGPVVRLGHQAEPVFREAANAPILLEAFDQLVGAGNWQRQGGLGTFPIRFPSPDEPGDTGWHVDPSFGFENPDFLSWRLNIHSQGRTLLMLFLLTDVGEADAPTRLRVGSHRDVARDLAPHGAAGRTLGELAADDFASSADRAVALAVGEAGTVYLCHPFLVHAAQPHFGTRPRIIAQPPLLPAPNLDPEEAVAQDFPVWRAIRLALDG
ncbi:phytanoyl-CoA dioxygenase family protein [Sphingosinicella terrae]|uniref:phytanoyl-CoA dioxygenase family protein n=1 Tax=Sphingosinicella terrae TaxID=2172047 RepID=UPI000E0CCBFD|nr:phytanoyl-CoA dioxygenase family protein [Sphingosinicella terrae]